MAQPSVNRQRRPCFSGERALELAAGAVAELREDRVEVILDGPRADEQPRTDLGVREPSRASRTI